MRLCAHNWKEDLNSPIKFHQEINNLRERCYVGQNFPKKYQQCVIQSRDRGESNVGHPTSSVHHSRERENLHRGKLGIKEILASGLRTPSSKGPLANGLNFHHHFLPSLNKRGRKRRRLDY